MTLFFERATLTDEAELERVVLSNLDAVFPGLQVVARGIPTEAGRVAALCTAPDGMLWVLTVSLEADDGILARALGLSAWAKDSLPAIAAISGRSDLSSVCGVRVAVVSTGFSAGLLKALDALAGPAVSLYEYRYVRAGDVGGLSIEPVAAAGAPAAFRPQVVEVAEAPPPEPVAPVAPEPVVEAAPAPPVVEEEVSAEPEPLPPAAPPEAAAYPEAEPAVAEAQPPRDAEEVAVDLTDEEVAEFMEFADQLRALSRSRPTYLR